MVAGMSDYRHKRHNVSSLLYHIVCPAKYRRVSCEYVRQQGSEKAYTQLQRQDVQLGLF